MRPGVRNPRSGPNEATRHGIAARSSARIDRAPRVNHRPLQTGRNPEILRSPRPRRKGVTFDSGGISIKPADGMEKMKYDMAGGAAVLGAMRAISQLKPAIPVTAFVPAVENMVGSRAQRPGDIVKSLNRSEEHTSELQSLTN